MEKSGYRRQKLRVRGGGVVVHGMEREFEFEESFTKLSDPSGRMRKRVSIEGSDLKLSSHYIWTKIDPTKEL